MHKKNPAQLNHTEQAIMETLCYFGVFNYPISFYKICGYLTQPIDDVVELAHSLHGLVEKGLVVETGNVYYLSSLEPVEVLERTQNSLKAIETAQFAAKHLRKIPWIKLFAVTGSVSAYNKHEEDDIDVFIVAQPHRLWITRFFVFLILKVLGLYRTDKLSKDKICTNLFVDEQSSSWEADKNIYIAHEIITMLPLISRNDAYFAFLNRNAWVQDIFPNFKCYQSASTTKFYKRNVILNAFEIFFAKLQLFYMHPKKTTEKVDGGVAHFNKSDSKEVVLDKYEQLKRSI